MPPVTSFVDAPNARLAVYEDGAEGDVIVLLHGGPGVPDYLADVAAILSGAHRVIRYDQRGTGRSTCHTGQYALRDYVDDLEAIRGAYKCDRFTLLGHSWGGTVAQLYAAQFPHRVAKVCLFNSGIGVGDDWRAMERAVMAFNRRRSGFGGFALLGLNQLMALLPGALGDQAAALMMARVWRNYFDPPASAPSPSEEWLAGVRSQAIFATRKAALAANADELRAKGSVPVQIIFGEHDIYGATTSRLIARYPDAQVVIIPKAGHLPWLQNRDAFIDAVSAFLASTTAVPHTSGSSRA